MEFSFFKKGQEGQSGEAPDLKQEWQSCQPGKDVRPGQIQRPRVWAPNEFAVKIMVARGRNGDASLNEAKETARAVMQVQQQLKEQFKAEFPDTKLLMSVETYHDGCRHATDWSDNPHDMESAATRWSCYTRETRIGESLDAMSSGSDRAPNINIIVGNKFDENAADVAVKAKRLLDSKGTQVFSLPLPGASEETIDAFRVIGEQGGGMALQPPDGDYAAAVSEITKRSMYKASGQLGKYLALPAPDDKTAAIRKQLENLGPK